MKKILVTGSLGYLGSVFTEYLADHGYDPIGYDTGFFKDGVLYPPKPTQTVMRDARDITEKDLDGVYAVVHLAGVSNDPFGSLSAEKIYDPTRMYARTIAEMCKRKGMKFIFASSCSVYGKGGESVLDEESPTFPQTPYSLNKLQVEGDLRDMAGDGFSPIALRFATAFGLSPRLRLDIVVNMFVGMAVSTGSIVLNSDGSAWRPNIHILDIAEALRRAIDSDWHGGLLVLNVGDDANNMKILDIANVVAHHVPGCQVKFAGDDPKLEVLVKNPTLAANAKDTRTYKVSFEKIKQAFPGYRAAWTIEAGAVDMIAKLQEMNFGEQDFKNSKFYRLRKIAELYDGRYISDDLRWLKPY